MRIGVVSDSHGNLYMLDKAIASMGELDMIIHLGDNYKDMIKINQKYNKPIEYVAGNNDFIASGVKRDKVLLIEGKRIFITHGHKYGVYNSLNDIYFKGLEENADIVLFGHTHKQCVERQGEMILLNPGSTSLPRDSAPGCAVLDIKNDDIDVQLMRIKY